MWYGISILICAVVIAVVNVALNNVFYNLPAWQIIAVVAANVVVVILIDGIFALIIRRALPKKWFTYERKCFQVGKRERKFYEKLGIRKWKDWVAELGMFTNFSKSQVANPDDNEYIERFLLESNYGYVIHLVGAVTGFLITVIFPLKFALLIGLPVGIVNVIYNLMSAFILRYNVPRLMAVHKRNEIMKKRAERSASAQAESDVQSDRLQAV